MDYEQAKEYTPTRTELEREIRQHGADPQEFYREVREPKHGYTGADVLVWLGY